MPRPKLIVIEAERPHPRRIAQVAEVITDGGVVAYPTDTVYGIGCSPSKRKAIDRIYRIKGLARGHPLSFICPDVSTASEYGFFTDFAYRWIKRLLPGPYTIVVPATRKVPKLLVERRKEIGIRIPDNPICQSLLETLGHPLVSTSATSRESGELLGDAEVIREELGHQLDLIVDGGLLAEAQSTVVSLVDDEIEIIREGKGPVDLLTG